MEECGASGGSSRRPSYLQQYSLPPKDPLNFNPGDLQYRLWCNCRILPGFLLVSLVQALLVVVVLVTSIGHLIHQGTATPHPHPPTTTPSFTDHPLRQRNVSQQQSHSQQTANSTSDSSRNVSTGEGVGRLFLEPFDWLVALRIIVCTFALIGLFIAYYGVWKQCPKLLLPQVGSSILAVLTIFLYIVFLTWHCVVREDYFAFCFFGLTLLFLLLVHVISVHCTIELHHYFTDLHHFLEESRLKWPEPSSPHKHPHSPHSMQKNSLYFLLMQHYLLSRAFVLRARLEEKRFCSTETRESFQHPDSFSNLNTAPPLSPHRSPYNTPPPSPAGQTRETRPSRLFSPPSPPPSHSHSHPLVDETPQEHHRFLTKADVCVPI